MVDQGDHELDAANMIAARRNLATPRSEINAAFATFTTCAGFRGVSALGRGPTRRSHGLHLSPDSGGDTGSPSPTNTRSLSLVRESAPPRAFQRSRQGRLALLLVICTCIVRRAECWSATPLILIVRSNVRRGPAAARRGVARRGVDWRGHDRRVGGACAAWRSRRQPRSHREGESPVRMGGRLGERSVRADAV
jgi:hypothetical protein